MYSTLEEYLSSHSIQSLITYDFKNEDPQQDVREESDPLNKFLLYKSNVDSHFDCDSSNGTCPLTSDIYCKLWGWRYEDRFKLPKQLYECFSNCWPRMGADTMNSFSTIYNAAKRIYKNDPDKLRCNENLAQFAGLTHSIGNFTLVPFYLDPKNDKKSFNSSRGYRGSLDNPYFVYDFFDLSLKLIQERVDEEVFRKYIDVFFLNDYVDKNYNVIPLFKRHGSYLSRTPLSVNSPENFLPDDESELNEYLENVIEKICARGERMINELSNQDL